jgi:hypothetical protein
MAAANAAAMRTATTGTSAGLVTASGHPGHDVDVSSTTPGSTAAVARMTPA